MLTSKVIRVGDVGIAYKLSGPGNAPVVLLSHCFSADHQFWDAHLPACEGFRVLRYDTRGHGASDHPPGPYTLNMLAGDVVRLLDRLAIERVHFAGVSMGGMIGQTFALQYPDRLASLALINTTPVYSADQRSAWRERASVVVNQGIDAVHEGLMRRWFTDEAIAGDNPGYCYMRDIVRRFAPGSFDAVTAAMCELDTLDRLTDIKVPTLVVAAPQDPGVPAERSQALADNIPDSTLHWLSPARHLATLEHVDAFNAILKAHLATVSNRH
jgi:3-oxoadipate enol-lactonase